MNENHKPRQELSPFDIIEQFSPENLTQMYDQLTDVYTAALNGCMFRDSIAHSVRCGEVIVAFSGECFPRYFKLEHSSTNDEAEAVASTRVTERTQYLASTAGRIAEERSYTVYSQGEPGEYQLALQAIACNGKIAGATIREAEKLAHTTIPYLEQIVTQLTERLQSIPEKRVPCKGWFKKILGIE